MQARWTVKSLLEWTTDYFKSKNITQARLEAEVLLARVLQKDRVYLYVHYLQPVGREERELFRSYIQRRISGEPIAYITGRREFMSLEFVVNSDVLIPRPETELLVENALELLKGCREPRICEIGTGSGAIAISLAHYMPRAVIMAGDISSAALAVARENANRLNVNVEFRVGNLLEPFQAEMPFDMILANLPYIPEEEFHALPEGVKNFEPSSALLAPGDGLDFYRRLVLQAMPLLKEQGYIIFEIGEKQGAAARNVVGGFDEVQLICDLAGRDRLIIARKGKENGDRLSVDRSYKSQA